MNHSEMRHRVIGIGAGGHAAAVVDTLRRAGRYHLHGLLDGAPERQAADVLGVPVLGGDECLGPLWQQGIRHAFIGVGSNGSTASRIRIWRQLQKLGFEPVDAIDPQAILSAHATVGAGVTILARAVVNARAQLGANVIVNTGAIIEHDCVVADHVHVATGAILTGGVTVETGAFVGAGACVRPGIRIGAGAVVGAGAAVVSDVEADTVVAGVPARRLCQEERSWMIRQAS